VPHSTKRPPSVTKRPPSVNYSGLTTTRSPKKEDIPIQVRHRENFYVIGRFIHHRAQALGLTRSGLVRRLGYRDIARGHTVLNTTLQTGIVPTYMADHLAAALEVDDALLTAVIDATNWQRRDETRSQVRERETAHRQAFRPHLRAETARTRPEPVFVAALLGVARLRHVILPEHVWHTDDENRDSFVKSTILDHFQAQEGRVPAFGEIVGYTLVTVPGYQIDFGLPFDVSGNRSGPMRPVQRLAEALLGTKRGDTRLTGLLKNVPIKMIGMNGPS